MTSEEKNRNIKNPHYSPSHDEWISLSEAAHAVPYTAEYLSLLARKKTLPAKKIKGVWYTTLPIVQEYMRRQMSRVFREPTASVENLFARTGLATSTLGGLGFPANALSMDKPLVPPEQVEKINETIFLEKIISQIGEKAAPAPAENLSADPAFSVIPSSLSFRPHLRKTRTISGDALDFAEDIVSAIREETSKEKTWAETPALGNESVLKIIGEESKEMEPLSKEDAYASILFQKFITTFTAFLDKEVQSRESFLVKTWHTVRAAYGAVLSHKKLFSLFLVFLLLFSALPFRVVSAFFDSAYRSVAAAVNDANTVLGFRPGTHANEILLLDQEGKIAIFGSVETEGQLKSFAPDGIAPIYVKSVTKVDNLNADYLDGVSSEEFTLAFVTKNGNTTYDNVFLQGKVEAGQTLLVRGAANLLSSLSVDGELSVFGNANLYGDATLYKGLTVNGPARFKNVLSAQEIFANAGTFAESLLTHGNLTVNGQVVVQGFGIFQGGVSADTGTFRRGVSTGGNLSARGDVDLGGVDSDISLASTLWSIDTEGNAIFSGDATIKDSLSVSATTSVNRLQAGTIGIGTTTPGYEIGVVGSGLFEGLVIAYEGFVGNAITATSTLSAEGLASFVSGFVSSASSTVSSTLHVLDALVASSSLVVDGLTELYGGFISSASSTVAAPFHVSDNLSASSTVTVGGLATFENGFVSGASSSATILSASDSLYASSSIAVDGMSFFALTGGSVGIASTSPAFLLSVDGAAYISDTLFVGNAITATSTLRVDGLSTLNGFISYASSTIGGSFYVQDNLSASSTFTLADLATLEGGAILGGASSTVSGTLALTNNVIANKGSINMGDAGTRFGIVYADEVNATTLVGTLTGGDTNASTFRINADAGDNEDSFLSFERGTETPNSFLQWVGADDYFIFNFGVVTQASSTVSGPFHVSDNLSASSTLTVASLATFDSGFISSASSTVSAPFHVSDIIAGSSTLAIDQSAYFALSSGNVGIASSTPWGLLSVEMNTTDPAFVVSNQGSSTPSFYIGGVNQNGFIGVGTTTPLSLVHIANNLQNDENGGGFGEYDPAILLTGSTTAITEAGADYNWIFGVDISDGGKFKIASSTVLGTSDRFVIDGAGNVGIGTASPSSKLSIRDADPGFLAFADFATSIATYGNTGAGNGSRNGLIVQAGWSTATGPEATIAQFSAFTTGAVEVPRMTIRSYGNVGIGTTNPQALLDVLGAASSTSLRIDGASGDAPITFATNLAGQAAVHSWTIGADQSDEGKFKIASSTVLGTSDRFVIDGAGNVGIGTTTPDRLLSISGTSIPGIRIDFTDTTSADEILFSENMNSYAFIDVIGSTFSTASRRKNMELGTATDGNDLLLYTNGFSRLAIDVGGNVGIGTTNPQALLDVLGAASSTSLRIDGASGDAPITFATNLAGQAAVHSWTIGADQSDEGKFKIASSTVLGTSDRFVIDGAGNVGIGTASPAAKLDISDTGSGNKELLTLLGSYVSGEQKALTWRDATNIVGQIDTRFDGIKVNMVFGHLYNAGYQTGDLVTILGNGNVGIGTTTPVAKLQVEESTNAVAVARLQNTHATNGYSGIEYLDPEENVDLYVGLEAGGDATRINYLQGDLTFYANSQAKVTLDSSGNVGIGTTSPNQKFVVRDGNKSATSGGGNITIYGTTAAAIDIGGTLGLGGESGQATTPWSFASISGRSEGNLYAGYLQFNIADAGGGISEKVRITSTGNVGIGTANPQALLDVLGAASSTSLRIDGASGDAPITFATNLAGQAAVHSWTIGADQSDEGKFKIASSTVLGTNDRFVIDGSGNVGIGTTSPSAALSVTNATGEYSFWVNDETTDASPFVIDGAGNVGIGTTEPNSGLQISSSQPEIVITDTNSADTISKDWHLQSTEGIFAIGTSTNATRFSIAASGGIRFTGESGENANDYVCINTIGEISPKATACTGSSALRYKENIENLSVGLDAVLQMRPIEFDWKKEYIKNPDAPRQIGFIAEEMEKISPLFVTYENGQIEGVEYMKLTSVLAKAIQEIAWRVDVANAPTTTPSLAIDGNGFVSTMKDFVAGRTLYVRDDTGFVGIGTSTPAYPLHVVGDIAANSFINVSTKDSKKDIVEIPVENYGARTGLAEQGPSLMEFSTGDQIQNSKFKILNSIKNLPIFEYRYTYEAEDAPLRMGLIAEESPAEVLSADKKGVDLYKLVTFTIGGVKELAYKVDALIESVAGLEERLTAVENSNARTGLATQGPSLLEFPTALLASLADFGMTVVDGVANFTNLVVENLFVQKLVVENMTANALTLGNAENRAGITMYDKNTGAPFCLSVINGNVATENGTCDAVGNSNPRTGLASQGPSLGEFSTTTVETEPTLLYVPTATSTEEIIINGVATTTSSFQFIESITNSDNADATTMEETAVPIVQIPDSSIQSETAMENSDASADLAPQGQTLLEFPTVDATTTETTPVEEPPTDAPTS